MPPGHGHSHGALPVAHDHGLTTEADRSRLLGALALIVAFMAVEVVVGVLASSLALISDAAHMLTDAGAIGFALVAMRLARRPPQGEFTFGLRRAEILAAQLNGATLLVLGLLIVYEGIQRLVSPPDTGGLAVLAVAIAGIGVNLAATLLIAGANRRSLNIEGAYQHIVTDLAAFVATALAGAVILLTGFDRADGIAALLVAALMLRSAFGLLRDSGRILLEAAPAGLDPALIGRTMAAEPAVENVHDLHLWEVTSGFPALSAHILVGEGADCHAERQRLEQMLHDRFRIDHVTLQVEHAHTQLLQIDDRPAAD